MTTFKKAWGSFLLGLLAATFPFQAAIAGEVKMINAGPDNVAIKGYDTVAYFTQGRPVKGKAEFAHSWNGAQWHFASAAHRDMFAADPERYAPQFGGFCSMALARSKIAGADPQAWVIVDEKLYLNFSKPVLKTFTENTHENIKKAELNWERLRKSK